jgi:hypothetical protein
MSSEIKDEILGAWNKCRIEHERRLKKNEASTTQYEDTVRLFKQGIVDHPRLSKKEKEELLVQIALTRPGVSN